MWIKQVIKGMTLKKEKKAATTKSHEAARNNLSLLRAASFRVFSCGFVVRSSHLALGALLLFTLLLSTKAVAAQETTRTPTPSSSPQQSPPAGTSTQTQQQQQQPGAAQPSSPTQLPPNAPGSVVRPGNEAQQSTQPQTVPQQQQQQTTPNTQGTRPISPQAPGQTTPSTGLPTTTNPAGTAAPQQTNQGTPATGTQTGVQQTPGQSVGTSGGIAPAELPQEPPPIATDYQAPLRPLPSAERVGVNVADQVPLTLNDAIRLALRNSNDIDQSRIDVQIAEYSLQAARGVYDPLLSSENYFERATTPTSSSIGGGGASGSVTQQDMTGSARLGGFSPWGGGAYQLDFSSTRLTTTNLNVRLNPQFPTAFTFTYTQPLWRGRRFDNNRRQIEIAKRNLSLTDAQFRQRAIDVISQVEQAYWNLAFALRNLQVQIDAVKQARIQVESSNRQVEKGVLAPIDVVAAQTQVTTFEQNVYTAQEAVTLAENTLKTLILPDRTDTLWTRAITPITPVNLEAPRVPLEQAVRAALDNRPELAQLKTTADINNVNLRYFRDQMKPQVDLVGTYTTVGLAGTLVQANPGTTTSTTVLTNRVNELSALAGLEPITTTLLTATVAPNLVGGYTQSLRNLIDQNYPTARVGVRLSLPLRNRTAEANLGASLAQGNRIKDQLAQAEQLIEADVRNSLQAVRSAEARLASAAATRSSAEQQYESEQRQFRAGTTTVFLVLQRQTNLLAARAGELQAQTDLNKAISAFQRATGRTLEANQISIRTDTPMRELEQSAGGTQTSGASNSSKSPAGSISSAGASSLNSQP
ncbi:MAG TPA: TolC family protein [Pyrinomonadaceae bacterium]|jgi:HAE1 family hydrophobic/amphiphilic exporter-1